MHDLSDRYVIVTEGMEVPVSKLFPIPTKWTFLVEETSIVG